MIIIRHREGRSLDPSHRLATKEKKELQVYKTSKARGSGGVCRRCYYDLGLG